MVLDDHTDTLGGDGVLGLVYGFAEQERHQRFLMTFHAVIDDSGQGSGGPNFVLAGFGARVSDWIHFERKWSKALKDENLSYFKMSEAYAWRGEFQRGWNEERRTEFFYRQADIIREHALFAIYVTIPREEFARFVTGSFAKILDQPYVYMAYVLMAEVYAHLLSRNIKESVDFVFDTESSKNMRYMADMFVEMKQVAPTEYAPFLGAPPVFRDDETFLPLQASDYFAWHVRRLKNAQDENQLFNTPWLRPLGNLPLARKHVTAQDLEGFVSGLCQAVRAFPYDLKRARHAKRQAKDINE